jgi:hypothetical protein
MNTNPSPRPPEEKADPSIISFPEEAAQQTLTVVAGFKVVPNFELNGTPLPSHPVKHYFTHQENALNQGISLLLPTKPVEKPKRKRVDPYPKLLEAMHFKSILQEDTRKGFEEFLTLEALIARSDVPNAQFLKWMWPATQVLVANWHRFEGFSKTRKIKLLRQIKKVMQLMQQVEKADFVCQKLLKRQNRIKEAREKHTRQEEFRTRLNNLHKRLMRRILPSKNAAIPCWAKGILEASYPEETAPAALENEPAPLPEDGVQPEPCPEANATALEQDVQLPIEETISHSQIEVSENPPIHEAEAPSEETSPSTPKTTPQKPLPPIFPELVMKMDATPLPRNEDESKPLNTSPLQSIRRKRRSFRGRNSPLF